MLHRLKTRVLYFPTGLLILLTAVSCAVGPRLTPAANEPQVTITAPSNGAAAGNVTVKVDVKNFKLASSANPNSRGQGHMIYYLDVVAPTNYEHEAVTEDGTYAVTTNTSYTWQNVTPGQHTFSVQLVNADDTPLPVPGIDVKTVTIAAPQGSPQIKITAPMNGDNLTPGAILVQVDVSNFILTGKMGTTNIDGAGHIIYYLDADPPTKPGEPAVADIYRSSPMTKQRWQSVPVGTHTLAVQLVNNDDTPLNPPVTDNISINVSAP